MKPNATEQPTAACRGPWPRGGGVLRAGVVSGPRHPGPHGAGAWSLEHAVRGDFLGTHARRAFTLLEVLLALGLTLLVLMAVGMAVDFYLRGIETSRANVEEAQLARALLNRIADDLRCAVRYDPINAESLVLNSGDLGGSSPPSDENNPPEKDSGSGNGLNMNSQPKTSDSLGSDGSEAGTTGVPRVLPGLYGTRTELQIDISRLPRLDQYTYDTMPVGESMLIDRLSDVKTVTYFVLDGESGVTASGQPRRGLVRGELDRAVSAYAAEQGSFEMMANEFEPIAPEVAAVEFEYFDGQEWLDSWDSQTQQGLPMMVRVTVYLYPSELRRGGMAWASPEMGYAESDNFLSYSLVVRLPSSEPTTNASGSSGSGDSDTDSRGDDLMTGGGGSGGGPGSGSASSGGSSSSSGGGSGPSGGSGGGQGSGSPGGFNPFGGASSSGSPFGGGRR